MLNLIKNTYIKKYLNQNSIYNFFLILIIIIFFKTFIISYYEIIGGGWAFNELFINYSRA